MGELKSVREKDWALYLEIWNKRPHIDFETCEPILGEPLTLYFHHVLLKSKYPQYRHKSWNIVLVNWNSHAQADQGKAPKIEAYRKELLQRIENKEIF